MSTHPSPVLCPACSTLIPLFSQLGGPDHLYCMSPSHWSEAGHDVTALTAEIQRYDEEILKPAREARWRLLEDERRIAEVQKEMIKAQRQLELGFKRMELMKEAETSLMEEVCAVLQKSLLRRSTRA